MNFVSVWKFKGYFALILFFALLVILQMLNTADTGSLNFWKINKRLDDKASLLTNHIYNTRKPTIHKTKSYSLPFPLRDWVFEEEDIRTKSKALGNASILSTYRKQLNRTLVEDFFRKGLSLEPYLMENGEQGWIENGILYKPSPKSFDKSSHRWSSPSGFKPYVPFNKTSFFFGDTRKIDEFDAIMRSQAKTKKVILFHTKSRYIKEIKTMRPIEVCPEFPCVLSTNKEYISISAALVFDAQLIKTIKGPPPPRLPGQVFVFHVHEPPFGRLFMDAGFKRDNWSSVFNWTMSYRLDSDIVSLYGMLRKRPKPLQKNYTQILAKKQKFVAWMVGHCGTPGKRLAYYKELQKYIPVDVYGACGKLKCSRSSDDACTNMVAGKYKFYLGFENSICPDYITEKFFKNLAYDIVTVGRASNDFHRHVPSEIFINTADYPSPKHLAAKLRHLASHDDEYINILKEKDKYMVMYEDYPLMTAKGQVYYQTYHYEEINYCEMCQKLWNLEREAKTIPSIGDWFDKKPCSPPTDIPLARPVKVKKKISPKKNKKIKKIK